MNKKLTTKELLLSGTNPKEFKNSVNFAFNTLVCSKSFSNIPKSDKARIIFHWENLRDFLNDL